MASARRPRMASRSSCKGAARPPCAVPPQWTWPLSILPCFNIEKERPYEESEKVCTRRASITYEFCQRCCTAGRVREQKGGDSEGVVNASTIARARPVRR